MKKIKIFLKSKWEFCPPKKKKFLIFDGISIPFFDYIDKNQSNILFIRGEKLNLYILFKCFIKNKFNFDGYIHEFIKASQPKVVLTFIDNNPKFYSLHSLGNFKTIFVQNGLRSKISDIFADKIVTNSKNKKRFKVDYMFVFNSSIGKLYNSFISGKFISIGSYKNNKVKLSKNKKKNRIIVISTYRDYDKNRSMGNNISWEEFTKNDKYFLDWLILLAKKYQIQIDILGRYSLSKSDKEYLYFKGFFKNYNFSYIDNYQNRDTYAILDNYNFAFTIDSTLGIERLARGGRVGFFCNRLSKIPIISRKFGWMENFKNKGPFWTYKNSYNELGRIFKTVVFSKKNEWISISKKYKEKIMAYDVNNKKFKTILKKISQ